MVFPIPGLLDLAEKIFKCPFFPYWESGLISVALSITYFICGNDGYHTLRQYIEKVPDIGTGANK
jgi:hypothetical protein